MTTASLSSRPATPRRLLLMHLCPVCVCVCVRCLLWLAVGCVPCDRVRQHRLAEAHHDCGHAARARRLDPLHACVHIRLCEGRTCVRTNTLQHTTHTVPARCPSPLSLRIAPSLLSLLRPQPTLCSLRRDLLSVRLRYDDSDQFFQLLDSNTLFLLSFSRYALRAHWMRSAY